MCPRPQCLGPLHCVVYFTVELAEAFAYEPSKSSES